MLDHFDFPTSQKDPTSAWQKQLARERAKQEEREAKILQLIEATIERFAQNDTRDYVLNPSASEQCRRTMCPYFDKFSGKAVCKFLRLTTGNHPKQFIKHLNECPKSGQK